MFRNRTSAKANIDYPNRQFHMYPSNFLFKLLVRLEKKAACPIKLAASIGQQETFRKIVFLLEPVSTALEQ